MIFSAVASATATSAQEIPVTTPAEAREAAAQQAQAEQVEARDLEAQQIAAQEAEAQEVEAQEDIVYGIVFPVADDHTYIDSWGAPRSGDRTHKGTDIFATKGALVVAAADGTVVRISTGERSGRYIVVEHEGGWRSYYLHLNNDTDGTDDGLSNTSAEGIRVGAAVRAGDLLDYVGDSGNAEETPSHLHFEIHAPDGTPTNPYPHLRAAENMPVPPTAIKATATESDLPLVDEATAEPEPILVGENVALVGRFEPEGGFAADITVHGDIAYLGTWGRPQACPASGVRMIDVSEPTEPSALAAIASGDEFPGTSTDSVWVGAVETDSFAGDLAVVALRLCDAGDRNRRSDAVRGLALYDVTDPAAPALLSTFDSGDRTQGVHELDVVARGDGSLLAAVTSPQSVRHTNGVAGDLRIVDLTDPTTPIEVADWDLRRDGPPEDVDRMLAEAYDELELHTHGATWTEDGTSLWLANWDAGVILLDTADAANPTVVTTFGFDPETDGNAHSVAVDAQAGLLIRNDQDLVNTQLERHGIGWGGQRFYDISDPTSVVELGAFMTERAASGEDGSAVHVDGRYSAHNAQVIDGIDYVAWYSDGLRIVDVSDPTAPAELGSFVPPAEVDPQGYWQAPDGNRSFAMVWGVHVADDLIYVSDMHSGLWIVRYVPAAIHVAAADRIT
jgi:hypothetical protein